MSITKHDGGAVAWFDMFVLIDQGDVSPDAT